MQCIKYGVVFLDPLLTKSLVDYNSVIDRMKRLIAIEKEAECSGAKRFLPLNESYFTSLSDKGKMEYAVCHSHELKMLQLQHKQCKMCHSVSITKAHTECRVNPGTFVCIDCKQKSESVYYRKDCNKLLPVWYDDNGDVQFELPDDLRDLRLGEQLLIQRFSCFVPLVHIRNGMMGLKGHCCCFKQEISDVCNSLPRTKVNAVKVIKSIRDVQGAGFSQAFYVRRNKVMGALIWLKKYHKWYREDPDLVINESNLDWMNGAEECELPGLHIIDDDNSFIDSDNINGTSSDIYIDHPDDQHYGMYLRRK
jgi:hypothetical protein